MHPSEHPPSGARNCSRGTLTEEEYECILLNIPPVARQAVPRNVDGGGVRVHRARHHEQTAVVGVLEVPSPVALRRQDGGGRIARDIMFFSGRGGISSSTSYAARTEEVGFICA